MDLRLKIIEQARKELEHKGRLKGGNPEVLVSLLDLLSQAIMMSPEIKDKENTLKELGRQLIDSQELLLISHSGESA